VPPNKLPRDGELHAGDAVRVLRQHAQRFAASIRAVTLPVTGIVAVAAADQPLMRFEVSAVFIVLSAWSAYYVFAVARGRPWWCTAIDSVLLASLALATPLLVDPSWPATGKSWVVPFCTFACVAYQYHERARGGTLAALLVVVAMVTGTQLSRPDGSVLDGLITACWSVVVTGLARLLWALMERGGRIADRRIAEAEELRREQVVAASLRADERATNRDLHDTSATTLLMVGIGEAGHEGSRLAQRAERDLAVLRGLRDGDGPRRSDLCALLDSAVEVLPLKVDRTGSTELWVPATTARALTSAAVEALTNVSRHSGTAVAQVRLSLDDDHVRVEIRDEGDGFDPGLIPATRRGVRDSIVGRMRAAGGDALIHSVPGRGTTVELRCARD
jgi:signal transduction histidine kinase